MDLFAPPTYRSIGGNSYCLVVVDDYSRYTCVFFLSDKSNVFSILRALLRELKINLPSKLRRLEVIMTLNSRTLELKIIVMKRESNMNFQPSTLRSKMKLLKGKIGL
jgi:transposase InsO family protein